MIATEAIKKNLGKLVTRTGTGTVPVFNENNIKPRKHEMQVRPVIRDLNHGLQICLTNNWWVKSLHCFVLGYTSQLSYCILVGIQAVEYIREDYCRILLVGPYKGNSPTSGVVDP